MFSDLCVPAQGLSTHDLTSIARELHRLGYGGVAFEFQCVGRPTPDLLRHLDAVVSLDLPFGKHRQPFRTSPTAHTFRVFSRLTVELTEATDVQGLVGASSLTDKFDILAVRPMTELAMKAACSTLEIDVVVIESAKKLPFYLRHKILSQGRKRGVLFEIHYHSLLLGLEERKFFVSNGLSLLRIVRPSSVIFSSGTADWKLFRGPRDVINLGAVFGIDASTCKHFLTTCPRKALRRGECRRSHKSVVSSVDPDSLRRSAGRQDSVSSSKSHPQSVNIIQARQPTALKKRAFQESLEGSDLTFHQETDVGLGDVSLENIEDESHLIDNMNGAPQQKRQLRRSETVIGCTSESLNTLSSAGKSSFPESLDRSQKFDAEGIPIPIGDEETDDGFIRL